MSDPYVHFPYFGGDAFTVLDATGGPVCVAVDQLAMICPSMCADDLTLTKVKVPVRTSGEKAIKRVSMYEYALSVVGQDKPVVVYSPLGWSELCDSIYGVDDVESESESESESEDEPSPKRHRRGKK